MAPRIITLVRHGQAHHNVDAKYHLHDPYLTPLGEHQCCTLHARFPRDPRVNLLLTSPLKRTIQTTLIGFAPQISVGTPVLALAELQETASLPCDTGSPVEELEKLYPGIDFSEVKKADGWLSKKGKWASDRDALEERAKWVRKWLKRRNEEHIVCVLHGGFLHYLTEDWTGHGASSGSTGWANTEFRSFVFAEEGDGLVETKESKERRTEKPLGKTERKQMEETLLFN